MAVCHFAHPFLSIARAAMGNCMSKLSVPVIGSLHFLKISPLIFQLSFKITNCHHETGFSWCLRLSAGFDQFRPHFALGMGLEILLLLLLLENSSFEVMPRAGQLQMGEMLVVRSQSARTATPLEMGTQPRCICLGLSLALVHLQGRTILCLSYSTF